MKRKSIWLVIGLMLAALLGALVGCKDDKPTTYALSETSITLAIGDEKQLTIKPAPKAEVSWASDDKSVATVADGLVVAVAAGDAVITATIEGVDDALTCKVKVTEQQTEVAGFSLDFTNLSLKTNETKQLNVLDAEGNSPASVTWDSADKAIATVSETGLVTAVAKGETKITATLAEGTLTCKVTVLQGYTYSLDKTELDVAVGGNEKLTLSKTPDDGEAARPHTFTSSNPEVATVEGGTGKVTGVAKGTATIICSVDGEELKATVTVTEYTVTLDGEAWQNAVELRVGESAALAITADPTRTIDASYHSDDESIAKITSAGIEAVARGTTNVSVTVGGRTWTTGVTVKNAHEYSFENDEITIKLGGTGTLTVVSDPVSTFTVEFENSASSVVTLTQEGAVATLTAVGLGDATITAKIEGTDQEVTATVHVVFGVEKDEVEYSAGQSYSVNLDTLDETYETIDWIYYGRENYIERKNGGNLLGTFSGEKATDFGDYRVGMNWTDGTTTQKNTSGRTDGITLKSGSFTVKVTSDVKYIAIFTGVYHGTNTTTISYNGKVCASFTFENNGNNDSINKNKQLIFIPDVARLVGDEMEFTISFQVGAESSHGWADNISLVAVAVVGNTERQNAGPSATAEAPVVTALGEVAALTDGVINLSEVGNEDWLYSKNGGNGLTSKSGVAANSIIKANGITYSDGPNDATLDNGFGQFTWYAADGTTAPANGKVNNFQFDNGTYSIPVHLTAGAHTVTLYLSGWKCSYFVAVSDSDANTILSATKVVNGNGSSSQAVEVKIAITVVREGDFTFRMSKDGDGNHGWAAIAVSNETAFELTQREYNLELGGESTAEILLSGTSSVTYESANTGIATVSAEGVITAVALGTTYITITDGNGAQNRVFVTVAKAASLNKTSLTLTFDDEGKKSDTLKVLDGDDQEVTEDVTFTSSNTFVVTVSENGLVEAKAIGKATITVQFGPTTFTCEVEVIAPNATLSDLNWDIESLARASAQYKTIDYKHWSNEATVVMEGGENLIGEPDGMSGEFWDYKGAMSYDFKLNSNRNLGKSYGKTCGDRFTIEIKLTENVTGVVFYTGAYRGTGVVSFKIGEKTLATFAFSADEGIARKLVVNIASTDITENAKLVIEGRVENKGEGGNVNVNALAVIGNVAQAVAAATGSAAREQINGRNLVDLTAVGSYDWLYSHYENPVEPTYRKFNGNNVFTGETYFGGNGNATDEIIRAWNGASAFKWTDGIRSDIQSTDEENYKASVNPVDNDGGGDWSADGTGGVDGYTNNYNSAVGEIHIQMHLAPGTYTIKAYLHSWKADLGTGIYDSDGNFITGKVCLSNEPGGDSDWIITFTLEVTKENTFNLVLGKVRSHGSGDRQFGWSAIAVAKND